jgi:hypothetical protein
VAVVVSRLRVLRREKSDSYTLIIFEIARELRPDRPEAMLHDAATDERLMTIAASTPTRLAEICNDRASVLAALKSTGRGGSRHGPDLADRFVVESLGHYFEWLTSRRPTVPFKGAGGAGPRDYYYGPFFLLCNAVFADLGQSVSSRQVFDLLRSIDIANWKTPEELRRPPWNSNLRKKQLPH